MNRIDDQEKNAHLTYIQQLYIYSSYCEVEKLADLYKRIRISTSTCKRIIKEFLNNQNRSKIYCRIRCRIRCRKMIDLGVIKSWISKYVRNKTSCFFASYVQAHIQKQLRVVVPIHQIRAHLKKVHNWSYKKSNSRLTCLNFKKF